MRRKLRRYRRININRALRPWSPWLDLDALEIDALLARKRQ